MVLDVDFFFSVFQCFCIHRSYAGVPFVEQTRGHFCFHPYICHVSNFNDNNGQIIKMEKKAQPAKGKAGKTTRKTPTKRTTTAKRKEQITKDAKTAKAKETFFKAYEANLGNVSDAARKAGVERTTYYRWCEADKEFKDKCDAVIETQKDFAESMLMRLIRDGDSGAIRFYLSTKGRDRGYGDKVEVTGAEGKDLIPNISIQIIDDKEDVNGED